MIKRVNEKPTKFVVEYKDEKGKIVSKWHYDLNKFSRGPILTEDFDLPSKEKKSKRKI